MFEFTPEVIAGIAGLILTLVFAYFPKLRVKYGGLESEAKSGIMIALLVFAASTIWILTSTGVIPTAEPVTWVMFTKILFSALITNQPTYSILPKAGDVKAVKFLRDNR